MSSSESKHWLASYPEGVPHDVDPDPSATIVSVLESSVRAYGKKSAFYYLGKSISYDDLDFLPAHLDLFCKIHYACKKVIVSRL